MPSYLGASIFRRDLNNVVAGADLFSAPAFLSRTPGYWALTIDELATMRFLENGENVVFLGPPGVGKTHLASALGLVAAQHRFSTYYINCHQLIEQLSMSEVKSIIFRYIHYYNRRRIYSTNGGLPPLVFRQAFLPACVALFPLWVLTELLLTFHSASICSDLKKRGVRNVFIACHDNLKGLGDAINAVFSEAKQQLCIVHQVRNSAKFVPWKDRKAVCADLKKIYSAVNLDAAEYAKEEFREKWDQKYPSILRSWDTNWAELTTFFAYPEQIRHLIYTTNGVEAYHRMVRKFTKAKAIFPTDDSIRKVVYLSVKEITKKWTMPVRDWGLCYSQIMVFFADRFAA